MSHNPTNPTDLEISPLPAELELGTMSYLNKELFSLLSIYGLENILDELSNLCREAALHAAIANEDYPDQVEWDRYGDHLAGLSYLIFKRTTGV